MSIRVLKIRGLVRMYWSRQEPMYFSIWFTDGVMRMHIGHFYLCIGHGSWRQR